MSDGDKGIGKGAGPERPMLVLGDDLPDVEDTTPEQLRRQAEEARREIEEERRRAQEEIETRRREAEREIAELEAKSERELKQRTIELERTQRKLYQRESRLLRRTGSSGSTKPTERLVSRPSRRSLPERGLRRSGLGIALSAFAVLGIAIGGLTAGAGADADLATELEATDRARVLWLQSGLAADEAIAQRMADLPVTPGSGGSPPGAALAQEAVTLAPDSRSYGERTVDRAEEMLAEETGTVRALTLWSQVHDEASYAVGSWEVADLREEAADHGAGPIILASIGLAALIALLAMALVARSWLTVPALVAAAGLAIAALPAISAGVSGGVHQAAEDHDAADDDLRSIYEQLGQDMKAAYGTSTSSYADREEYWTDDPFYDVTPSPGLQSYLDAREAVGEAEGDPAIFAATAELVQAGQAAFEERLPPLEEARGRLLDGMEEAAPRGVTALLSLGSAALVVTGVVISRGRRESA